MLNLSSLPLSSLLAAIVFRSHVCFDHYHLIIIYIYRQVFVIITDVVVA